MFRLEICMMKMKQNRLKNGGSRCCSNNFVLQSCSKIIEKTVKIGILPVSTSNVKLFLETIWSG